MTGDRDGYVLGSGPGELQRLDLQSEYYLPATEDALRRGGLGPGMHVLEIGAGTGGMTVVAADLVGRDGAVLAVDASADSMATARDSARRRGLDHVVFEQADVLGWAPSRTFDALVGRLVLMHLPDPAAVVRRLARAVVPGGLVLFQDFAMSAARQHPETPLFRLALDRALTAFAAAGRPTDMGYGLGRVLRAAGLPDPVMSIGGRWEDGPDATAYRLLAQVTRTLLPVMVSRGVATEAEVDVDHLEERLRAAAAEAGSGVSAAALVTAWSHTPQLTRR
jgi:ubiquinone/menaquinone biosynthesis C-methylase UbiE